jgi:hypothetical protein
MLELLHPFSYNKKHKLGVAKKNGRFVEQYSMLELLHSFTAIVNNTLAVVKKNGRTIEQ